MTLSDDSVSRENLLFYLDCMEAPDEEADGAVHSYTTYKSFPELLLTEDLRGTYAKKCFGK